MIGTTPIAEPRFSARLIPPVATLPQTGRFATWFPRHSLQHSRNTFRHTWTFPPVWADRAKRIPHLSDVLEASEKPCLRLSSSRHLPHQPGKCFIFCNDSRNPQAVYWTRSKSALWPLSRPIWRFFVHSCAGFEIIRSSGGSCLGGLLLLLSAACRSSWQSS